MKLRSALPALVGALALTMLSAVTATAVDDPNLDQQLDDLAVAHGTRVLDAGHVDMGPKYDDGVWTMMIHDDVAKADANATSVWRHPDETVFHVLDQSELQIPDDPIYSFIGPEPGESVWVIPQTQNPDVVWLGWNTQDPEVMTTIDRGITLSLDGVQGPGDVSVYLQSGTFGEPQVLWDSRQPEVQPLWVDVNTHTHANWAFTEPGVYLMQVRADADLLDGSQVSDTQVLRFAVGTATSTDEALAATWEEPTEPSDAGTSDGANNGNSADSGAAAPGDSAAETDAEVAADSDQESSPLVPILVGAIILVAVALIAGFTIAVVRGNRARKQVLAQRATVAAADEIADKEQS
ncbi:surface-anchored protein [Micrococcales bacterium KH10]|nr:surface-anchored protein [Micrococcales bacterium KH10]